MSGKLSRKVWGVVGAFGLVLTTGVIAIPSHSTFKVEAAIPPSTTDVNTVPHYFGPYSNWANSEQAVADAVITIGVPTGASPVQATATANVLPDRKSVV